MYLYDILKILLTVVFNFTETATIYSVDLAAKSRKSKQIILTISTVVNKY